MANPNFFLCGLGSIAETTSTVINFQMQTSAVAHVVTIAPVEKMALGRLLSFGPSTSQLIIIETETTLLVISFMVTPTPAFTITRTGDTPAITQGLSLTSLPSVLETSPGSMASSAMLLGSRPPPTIPSSSASPSSEPLGPKSIPQPSSGLNSPSTKPSSLPTAVINHNVEGSNKTLVWVLPSVLLPVFLIITLMCLVFRKHQMRRRLAATPTLIPFTNSRNAPRPTGFSRNMFVVMKRTRPSTVVGEGFLSFSRSFDNTSNLRHGDRGTGVTFSNNQIEGRALPVIAEELELPVASSDNLVVPASRSEILQLQTRLVNIEARRISLPPPDYSSERGR